MVDARELSGPSWAAKLPGGTRDWKTERRRNDARVVLGDWRLDQQSCVCQGSMREGLSIVGRANAGLIDVATRE